MDSAITEKDITDGIPEKFRPFFVVSAASISQAGRPIIESIWEAIQLFAPVARISSVVHIVIASRPFRLPLSNGVLEFHPHDSTVAAAVEHIVFLDVNTLAKYPKDFQVATVIKEFVHSVFHIADEALASQVVALIYPRVRFDGERFLIQSQDETQQPLSAALFSCSTVVSTSTP